MSISCAAIANLTLLVMAGKEEDTKHRDKIDSLRQYASYRNLPEKIARRMIGYVENQWASHHGLDVDRFEAELPSSLRQKTVLVRAARLLRRLPALSQTLVNAAVINALALKLEACTYAPQDDVIRPGERVAGAILVAEGEMDVRSRTTDVHDPTLRPAHGLVRLRAGDNFGLQSLFKVQQSKVLVQAHSYCEMFWLLRRVFMAVCREQCTPAQLDEMSRATKPPPADLRQLLHAGFGRPAGVPEPMFIKPISKQSSMMDLAKSVRSGLGARSMTITRRLGRGLTRRISQVLPMGAARGPKVATIDESRRARRAETLRGGRATTRLCRGRPTVR